MWRCPGARKHALPQLDAPSEAQAAASTWFSPLNFQALQLASRTWIPAMVPWRASEEGLVTQDVLDWYIRFAQGQPGALVVEATGIRDVPSGPLLRIGDERFLPGLTRLVDAVKQASGGQTRVFIQLIDFLHIRRRPDRTRFLREFLRIRDAHRKALGVEQDEQVRARLAELDDKALQAVLDEREWEQLTCGDRQRVTDVDSPHIRDLPAQLPRLFADAAELAARAGFDGVELHYAHAYTMASFLSRLNDRDDGYGGSREGRLRAPLEVYDAVRSRVGTSFAVGCRMLAEECIDGGSDLDDAAYFACAFAKRGMDFISLSRGGKFEDAKPPKEGWAAYPYTGRSGWECMPTVYGDAAGPFGRNVEAAGQIRRAVRDAGCETPIVVAGGICSFSQAEGILREGSADIVGAARQSLADPDWFRKLRLGHGEEVRRCTFTNYCEGLDQKHKVVTCKLWDREGLDAPGVRRTTDGRRRTTAPAWPARAGAGDSNTDPA